MKKKFLLLFTGILFLWGMLFTGCSSDSDSDDADRTPPAEIIGLNAVPNDSSVFLTWTNPADKDFYGVEVSAVPAEGTLKEPVVVNTIFKAEESTEIIAEPQDKPKHIRNVKRK